MWPLVLARPGWALWSIVPFLLASSRFAATIVTPLRITVTSLPWAMISSWFHWPTGFKNPRLAGTMP